MTGRLTRWIGVGVLLVGLITGFVLWWASVLQTQLLRVAVPPLAETASTLDPASVRTLADALRRAIVAQPLDQDLVDRFVAVAQDNRLMPTARLDAWRSAMARLGWRSTPAQQTLLASAANSRDLPALLDRVDAMLRREQLTSQLIVLLYIAEQAPQTHAALIDRLEGGVPWRGAFFADPRGVATPENRAARFATIATMLVNRYPVGRAEIAPLLNAMVTAGETASAYRLWRSFRAQPDEGDLPGQGQSFDPDFAAYAKAAGRPPEIDLPFEWQTSSGVGYSADIAQDGVTLHWDGSGIPVMLSQIFHSISGAYTLRLSGIDANPEFFNRFEVAARCPQGDALFTVLRHGADGALRADADRPIVCDYPILVIRGRANLGSLPVDASLGTIVLNPLHR